MEDNGAAFDGVSFHCYAGSVGDQETFRNAYPDKNIYFTECSGTIGSDWWSDIKVGFPSMTGSRSSCAICSGI